MSGDGRRHVALVCLLGLLIATIHGAGWLVPFKTWLTDLRFGVAARPPSGEVIVVDIDAQSLSAIGEWPWRRSIHADLVRALVRLGAAEMAFDIDFSARSSETEDEAFETALREADGSVLLATFGQRLTGDPGDRRVTVNRPIPRFAAHSWPASVNVQADPDGKVRRYPLLLVADGESIPSLGAIYGGAQGGEDEILIDFGIAASGIDRVSAIDLLGQRVDRRRVAGKKVIVGAAALELRDLFQAPAQGLISGPVLQAIAAETLLQNRSLRETGTLATLGGLAAIALVVVALARRNEWRVAVACIAAGCVLVEGVAIALQVWRPLVLDTSAWQVMLSSLLALTVGREIGLRRILLAISRAEIRDTRTVLDQVIADNFDGIVVADEGGTIQSASRAAIRILQPKSNGDWTGRPIGDLLPPELARAMLDAMASDGIAQDQVPRQLSTTLAESGERVLEYVITPSRLSGGLSADGVERAQRAVACLTFRDITERRLAETRLAYLARFDTLTMLPNRNHFMEKLAEVMNRPASAAQGSAVLHIGLDRFKTVNDTLGHSVGDQLLQAVARRALRLLPPPHVLARFGGDEFAAICVGPASREDLAELAARLIARLSRPYDINGHRLAVGASVGIRMLAAGDRDLAAIVKNADTALYRAKRDGGGTTQFFSESMDVELQLRHRLEAELWDALARKEFQVFYQPQFDLRTGAWTGVEALLRWRHPQRGYVSPAEFIPVAEEIGLMEPLGNWVLHQACAEVAQWSSRIKLAVNVSPVQFMRSDLVREVEKALAVSGLPAEQLELEITESLFIQESDPIRRSMDELVTRGIGFALDDFGTGYSSLSYIRKFPIGKIKIDRSFVSGLPHDREAVSIVQAVLALASNLGIRTNAEGLEHPGQIALLRSLGCGEGQGFAFGRPRSGEDLLRELAGGVTRASA